jgi:hypothetical protein
MLDSSSPNIHNVAGVKRLLPAFEPSSSPPRFKRQKSRSDLTTTKDENRYPTPVPSSSIGILPSSPPPISQQPVAARPSLRRSQSTVTERAPLSAVPSITLPANGQEILLGRSSNSSHYRLSANRLISRVHIKAAYHAPTDTAKANIQLKCVGWNGVKVHCQGRAWELQKDDIFMSETEGAEVMLDVHDSRVVLEWPRRASGSSGDNSNVDGSPSVGQSSGRVHRSPSVEYDENAESFWEHQHRINGRVKLTPVSPTPKRNISGQQQPSGTQSENFLNIYEDEPATKVYEDEPATQVYEDEPAAEEVGEETQPELPAPIAEPTTTTAADKPHDVAEASTELASAAADPALPPVGVFSTAEPLRTPPRSFRARPRVASSSPLSLPSSDRSASISPNKYLTLQNHLTNQLAFSRVNTMPLSELYANLPAALAATVTKDRVKDILLDTVCIGEIKRVGKDAAGKPLENHYYYMLEEDRDEGRKAAVGGRAGMRNCRKSHKVCFDTEE